MSSYLSNGEYVSAYTAPYSEYSNLNRYNTQFGPRLPPSVPSMSQPIILEQGNKYGYDALTHHTDGNQYYNIGSAYGNSCTPKYYVAQCPSNKKLRPFPPTTNTPVVESFQHDDRASVLKNLDVTVFLMKGCVFCEKLKALLRQHGLEQVVTYADGTDPKYKDLLRGVRGFPHYRSAKTGKSGTGYPSSIDDLIKNLA